MKNYLTIVRPPISFTATILGIEVPVVADQEYTLGHEALLINYKPFNILPSGYDAGMSSVSAYIYAGTTLLGKIDLTCECLKKISGLDWINHD
jgi:hypothetical protein